MHFLFKFIPLIFSTCFLRRQFTVHAVYGIYHAFTLNVSAASQSGCTINTTDCMYSNLPPEDEQFIYSKHVVDFIGINLKRKCISLVLITQIYHDAQPI